MDGGNTGTSMDRKASESFQPDQLVSVNAADIWKQPLSDETKDRLREIAAQQAAEDDPDAPELTADEEPDAPELNDEELAGLRPAREFDWFRRLAGPAVTLLRPGLK